MFTSDEVATYFMSLIDYVIWFLAILLDRPRVISANVGHAWNLPENTFGAAYARFMGSMNFSPDGRPPVRFMETVELTYVAMRAREVHNFWHTLFDLPTNLIGESSLKRYFHEDLDDVRRRWGIIPAPAPSEPNAVSAS
ncbi:hypothetical protein GIB67_036023 [Kingdonia uniflora]|uniref:Uncharacterized protein n=1 Tax=Kingdonia uniflora TaxID=39325 RepID=A0A7J7M294_9MAGN|nr:hypothetical protein GIB67_002983 [Kingdonia uniflora]KAF6160822.1 hypothetical protein GIB67_036023 [Kingdonia uniflora]